MIRIENFATKEDLFAYLKANKSFLVSEKKSAVKHADAVSCVSKSYEILHGDTVEKIEAITAPTNADSIDVVCVINTTNIIDSHGDVHMPGIWKKTLAESKYIYLIKEHDFSFDSVISDKVEASAKMMTWTSLGFPQWNGKTQALVFKASIDKSDKTGMFERYRDGKVHNHSVGMRYIKLELAINSDAENYTEEKAIWDKYIGEIVNADIAKEAGYFWAVLEAQLIEGSAVLRGSNYATPTISVKDEEQPSKDTEKVEPQKALEPDNIFTRTKKHISLTN